MSVSKGKKKTLFERAIDALTNRDEREAEEAARKQAEVRDKNAAEQAAREKAATGEQARNETDSAGFQPNRVKAIETRAITERIAAPERGVVTVRSLRIRADHSTTAEVVGGLVKGDEVTILSTWSDGRDTWAQLDRGWAAMIYNGETYIQPA